MDLTITDVAGLLNVSEKTVNRWLQDGKIPAYTIDGQHRFSRLEIESWVINQKHQEAQNSTSPLEKKDSLKKNPQTTSGNQKFSLYRALHKGLVLNEVPGNTKEEIIQSCTKILSENLACDPELLADLLLDREKLQSTGLNNGIAVPHNREFHSIGAQDMVTIVFPKKPIPYGSLDGIPVNTLFFLFAGNDKRHLHLLAKIAHLSSQKEALNLLNLRPSKEKLLQYVQNWEENIPHPED